jgi:hypothetical protein
MTFKKRDYVYPKILEGRTNRQERLFQALSKVVSTKFGLRNVEKFVEKTFRTVCSAFQIFVWEHSLLQKKPQTRVEQHAITECAMFETNGNVTTRLVSKYTSHCL